MSKSRMFTTHNDIPKEKREKIVALLNQNLANTADLASQVKQAHWNVKGVHFMALHKFFDELHERLEEHVDLIAERATTLGGTALGTARMAAANSKITEYPENLAHGKDHVTALVERYGQQAKLVRHAIDACEELEDADTQDLFTDVSRQIDMDLWFLEAHVQEPV